MSPSDTIPTTFWLCSLVTINLRRGVLDRAIWPTCHHISRHRLFNHRCFRIGAFRNGSHDEITIGKNADHGSVPGRNWERPGVGILHLLGSVK